MSAWWWGDGFVDISLPSSWLQFSEIKFISLFQQPVSQLTGLNCSEQSRLGLGSITMLGSHPWGVLLVVTQLLVRFWGWLLPTAGTTFLPGMVLWCGLPQYFLREQGAHLWVTVQIRACLTGESFSWPCGLWAVCFCCLRHPSRWVKIVGGFFFYPA